MIVLKLDEVNYTIISEENETVYYVAVCNEDEEFFVRVTVMKPKRFDGDDGILSMSDITCSSEEDAKQVMFDTVKTIINPVTTLR